MLEEEHRVFAPERGPQEPGGVGGPGREGDDSPGMWAKIDSPHWLCQIAPPVR